MCLIPSCSNVFYKKTLRQFKPIVDIITDGFLIGPIAYNTHNAKYDENKLLEHKLKKTTTTTLKKKKKATTANAKNMTGTYAVSVEGVHFSGIFVELWRKGETASGLQTIYS